MLGVVIGLDLGTQGARAVAYGRAGSVLALADEAHAPVFPRPGHAEQDTDAWLRSCGGALRGIADALGPYATEVEAICIAAQVDGVVPLDADRRACGPALIWLDRRAVDQRVALEAAIGTERLKALTGLNADSSHAAPKMMWLRDVQGLTPRWFAPPTSFLVAWLCGELVQDHANASSSMLYDVASRHWSEELLSAAGLDADQLPALRESTDLAGALRPQLASELGLPATCQVLVGTGDDHGAALGVGAIRPGIVVDVGGTAEPVGTTAATAVMDPEGLVETHAHAVPDHWFLENPGFVSGGSVLWVASLLDIEQGEVFDLAAKAPAGAGGLRFLPALSGAMAPRWNEHARGVVAGASMDHGRSDLCRAVIEGCAFALRDCVDRLEELVGTAPEIRATGGGVRSRLWMQVKADVTGRPLRPVEGYGAATGAAALAAVSAGWGPDLDTVVDGLVDLSGELVAPTPEHRDLYEDAYASYRGLYDAVEPTFTGGRA